MVDGKSLVSNMKYWLGVVVTIIIFIVSQVYMYGQFSGVVNAHVKDEVTHSSPKNMEQYLTEKEFEPYEKQLNRIENKLNDIDKYLRGQK